MSSAYRCGTLRILACDKQKAEEDESEAERLHSLHNAKAMATPVESFKFNLTRSSALPSPAFWFL